MTVSPANLALLRAHFNDPIDWIDENTKFEISGAKLSDLLDAARRDEPVREPVPAGAAPELWLQLVDVDGEKRIRRWQSTPFEGGVRYACETVATACVPRRIKPRDRVRRTHETAAGWAIKQGGEYTVRALDPDGDLILDIDDPRDKLGWAAGTFELVAAADPPLPDFCTWFHARSSAAISTAPDGEFRYIVASYLDELRNRVAP